MGSEITFPQSTTLISRLSSKYVEIPVVVGTGVRDVYFHGIAAHRALSALVIRHARRIVGLAKIAQRRYPPPFRADRVPAEKQTSRYSPSQALTSIFQPFINLSDAVHNPNRLGTDPEPGWLKDATLRIDQQVTTIPIAGEFNEVRCIIFEAAIRQTLSAESITANGLRDPTLFGTMTFSTFAR